MTLAEFIKRERVRCGLTQADLAVESGVPIKTIHNLEQGRMAGTSVGTFQLLWKALAFDANDALADLTDLKSGCKVPA